MVVVTISTRKALSAEIFGLDHASIATPVYDFCIGPTLYRNDEEQRRAVQKSGGSRAGSELSCEEDVGQSQF